MQKVKNLFCENRGRKLAVLLLGAFGYALLTALCSQIEQFGATAWSRTLARFAAAFPIAFVVLAALLAIAMPKLMCRPRESQNPSAHGARRCCFSRAIRRCCSSNFPVRSPMT
ncbi:MAG: hypothetical protein ACLR07_15175 [Christensenellales bacterium]